MTEHRTVIMTVTLILFFGFMVVSIPSALVTNQGSTFDVVGRYVEPPDFFDAGSLSKGTVASQDYGSLSYPILLGQTYNLTYRTLNDTKINVEWILEDRLLITHTHKLFYIFNIHKKMMPYPKFRDDLIGNVVNNVSEFYIRCHDGDIPEVFASVSFDNATYDTLTDAWTDGEILIYFAFLSNSTIVNYNAWSLMSSLLTFSMPDVHPAINFFIGIPIWICIIISTLYVLDKILPF